LPFLSSRTVFVVFNIDIGHFKNRALPYLSILRTNCILKKSLERQILETFCLFKEDFFKIRSVIKNATYRKDLYLKMSNINIEDNKDGATTQERQEYALLNKWQEKTAEEIAERQRNGEKFVILGPGYKFN